MGKIQSSSRSQLTCLHDTVHCTALQTGAMPHPAVSAVCSPRALWRGPCGGPCLLYIKVRRPPPRALLLRAGGGCRGRGSHAGPPARRRADGRLEPGVAQHIARSASALGLILQHGLQEVCHELRLRFGTSNDHVTWPDCNSAHSCGCKSTAWVFNGSSGHEHHQPGPAGPAVVVLWPSYAIVQQYWHAQAVYICIMG